jgi:hypothetical protein
MYHAPAVAISLWLALLAALLTVPHLTAASAPGDALIRDTIRLALLYYGVAAALMLRLRPAEWQADGRGRLARWCWTLAWAAYVTHVGMAFHYKHGWSHADAMAHTEERSGFGPGIYVSHLFTLLWTADVVFWWLRPRLYAARTPWVDWALHGFMAFMIFNGTVVFESGFSRWAGLALFTLLAALWLGAPR